ncbi:hypothetical protein OUZ56_016175 [Daphnia magna]|uniref:Helicase c-terminal domain containing protein n=1 Tax=Daphnia magna TaxID=35525 RepID=A0ABR0AQB5_9CRUS|nr:hypothetical protein OUZ56_016175 [Daphnia magna]
MFLYQFPTKMDEKNSTESSNIPTSKSLNNSNDVIEKIRSWIQSDVKSKFHEDAVKYIKSVVVRDLSSLENTLVEILYVEVVLEMWLENSLRKTDDYLNDETIDISVEMPILLKELNSINSFEDIGLKLNETTCQLTNLCDTGCQYLQLILNQVDLFKNTPRFSVLVASYFKEFKASCVEKVFSRCLDDVGKDQTNGKRNRELIATLNALFQDASEDVKKFQKIKKVLEEKFTGKDVKDFDDTNGKDLINRLVEIFASCSDATKNESLNQLKSEKEWAPKLEVLVKETCKAFLFPKTTIKVKDEYGRKIIFIKGVSVFVSKMIEEMQQLKESNSEVQEIQIVGLSSVHVDHHLENETWHGTNVGIVADKIFVDYEVCRENQKNNVCWDVSGKNGEPGQPGKSGGNVTIICNEMIDAERWQIISDGGKGGDGQNGTNGDKKANKWSKEYFNQLFPSMSMTERGEQEDSKFPADAVKIVLTTLNDLLPVRNRKSGKDIRPDYQGNFFIDGTAKDGSTISVLFYQSMRKRHTLVLCQGSNVEQGGSGGTMIFECMTGKNSFAFESSVPVVGKENRQPRAVRMGVYQAMGSDGVMGIPVGDVGFIHRLDTSEASADKNETGHYIGFENDVSLRMKFTRTKPARQPNDPDNYYAKLRKGEYASIAYHGLSEYGQVQPLHSEVVNATKKKGIIRQSLVQQVRQVDERKQMLARLQERLDSNFEEEKKSDEEMKNNTVNQMKNKETQLYQFGLMSQSGRGLENIGSMRFVKPAIRNWNLGKKMDVHNVLDTSRFLVNRRSTGCRPVDSREKSYGPVKFLCMLPTTDGVDSAIHSIFGQINSNGMYVCNDVKMFRRRLATFIRKKENRAKVSGFIKQFVLRVTNSGQSEFNWQSATEFEDLYEEYAKFVEIPSNPLESAEVEMLAKIHGRIINVYNDQSSSSFKYKETLNDSSYKHHYILHHGNGEWQRVEPKNIMNNIIIDTDLFEYQSIMTNPSLSFPDFLDFLKKQEAGKQIITSVEMLNPENGDTPDKLFQLLLERFQSHQNECSQEDDKNGENSNLKSMLEMNKYIWKWIEELNSRNFSPIFYLNIIKNNSPNQWIRNFVILEIYDRLTEESNEIGSIQKELDKIAEGMPSLLPVLRDRVVTSDSCAALQPQNLLRLLKTIAKDCGQSDGITRQQWPELQHLPLSHWYYHLRSKVWEKKAISDSSNPEAVYKLLELEFEKDEDYCDKLENDPNLKTLLNTPIQKHDERNIDNIIKTMTDDEPKLEGRQSVAYTKMLKGMKEKVEKSKQKPSDDKQDEERINKWINKWQTEGLNDTSFFDFLYAFDYAVQKTCTKEGDKQTFQLRDTQRVAILTLLTSEEKTTLTQVSTGEGKSLIVAGVAIAFALGRNQENKSKNVDVITSNDVLAHRDSMLLVTDGGLRNLYEYFNVSVANNCSQWVDERTQAYNAAVVYGQLANFQRDYLLDKFYDHNIRGDRTMDFVIIDEVDCMLLDRGNNTLYLSHDIPGMEMLESLYVFIWEKIRSSSIGLDKLTIRESVKSAVLYDLYGAITKGDLESIHNPLKDQPSEKNALWDHLIETKVIDPQGRLLMEDKFENIKFKKLLDPKIIFYLRNVAKRERSIRIPEHLMSFVDRHLHNWLDNAMQALELRRDEDYVVDQDRTDTSPDLNPQVIIIDQETGVDQTSSQWDGALHQFIQLKEGCKLTPQSIKAYFISNARYIKTYEKAAGVSGTLGSVTESQFMQRNYENLQFVIPTAFQKCFYLKPTQVFKSKDDWCDAIVKEARQIIQPKDQAKARSLVIFCQSIKDVKVIHQDLTNALGSERNDNHIHCYTRDYEKFAFEGKSLKIGQVIVATNLAGRGTDIKISKKLRENGGLHICLTFLPKNERIEEQAMGRSARNGAPGSGVFILYEESPSEKEWGAEKWFSMKEERQWREKQRISRLQKDFETMYQEQQIFDDWSKDYTKLKQELKNQRRDGQEIKTICENVLDDFSFRLDQLEDYRDQLSMGEFEIFRAEFKLPDIGEMKDTSWMTPVRSVAMAKHMITQIDKKKRKKSLSKAGEILNKVIASKDSSLYPAAHYYLAFILFEEDFEDNKDKVIQIVQTCETILNTHIKLHLSFYHKVPRAAPEQTPSFCVVDAYKQQKNNMVKILEYFIGSVRALLGSHYCSASNLKEAGRDPPKIPGVLKKILLYVQKLRPSHFSRFQKKRNDEPKCHKIDPEKADKLFQSLVKEECITCQLNDIHTVPNLNGIIQKVADEYGIKNLLENLKSVFGENLIEEQIEKKLKEKNLIPCTRKAFWEKLKKARALEAVKGGLCSQMKCVIMLESECDVEPSKPNSQKLDRDKRINFKIEDFQFGLNSFDREHNCLNVLYNPIYDSMKDLSKQNKIMFSKRYVIERLGKEEYRSRKEEFESNQIAQLNLDKLESVSLKFSDPLGKHDLERVKIFGDEQDGVWNALVDQQIIDLNGKLSSNFQKFSYPECPAYEEPVMRVIGKIFVAEIVKRQWLRAAQDPNCLKAINLLPLKPYRDMLGDLMTAHVISGARVTENTKLIEEKTDALEDEDERECVRRFLKSRQAVYAPKMKKYDVYLDFIEMDIRKIPNTENISTELHSFDLVGFNHVIDIKDREMSWKTYLRAIGAGAVGIASIGVGVFLIHANLLSFGLSKNVLFMGGASDILHAITAILTCSNFSWADYTRQRLMSAIGKAEPMDMIKTIFKLYSSTENADFREAIQLAVGEERWKRQGRSQTDRDSEVASGGTLERIGLKKHKTEFYFHSQLHYLLQDFGIFVHGKIKKCLDKNLNEIRKRLTQFNDLHGLETSQHFVREKMNEFISDWATEGHKWVSEITTAMTSKLDEIHMVLQQTEEIPLTQEIADEGIREMEPIFHDYEVRIRLIRITVTCISEFLSDLENYDNPEVAREEDIGVEEAFKRFQERMLADIEAELERQVDKILDSLRKQIHRVASNQVSNLAKINSEIFTTFLQFT